MLHTLICCIKVRSPSRNPATVSIVCLCIPYTANHPCVQMWNAVWHALSQVALGVSSAWHKCSASGLAQCPAALVWGAGGLPGLGAFCAGPLACFYLCSQVRTK